MKSISRSPLANNSCLSFFRASWPSRPASTNSSPCPAGAASFVTAESSDPSEMLHADLSKLWTVDHLARAVGLSRPVFARQFVKMMRLSPMRYLAHRRLERAAELLLDSSSSLAEIAQRVGYRSEFAFGRAFKRHHGIAPGQYRRDRAMPGVAVSRAA